jgi:tRNA 2-thiouridine synthesizing protein A
MFLFGLQKKLQAVRGRTLQQTGMGMSHEVELPGLGLVMVARTVDCIGDSCPKPQLLTLKALNQLPEGAIVELITDNPTAVETIPAMMLAAFGQHLASIRSDGCWKVYVRKDIE